MYCSLVVNNNIITKELTSVSKLNLSNDFIISGLVFAVTAMLKYFKLRFISGLRGSTAAFPIFYTIHSSFCFNKMASAQSMKLPSS